MLVDQSCGNVILAKMKEKKPLEEWQKEDARNLRRLFDARTETVGEGKQIPQMEFGAKYGIGSQGMVWQYISGRRPLNIKAAVAFAKGLGVELSDFSPTLAAQIDDASRVGREQSPPRIVSQQDDPQLQWVSSKEAALLTAFRACANPQQQRLLAIATGLAGGTSGQQPQGDGATRGNSG
jgi:hypothetical protein